MVPSKLLVPILIKFDIEEFFEIQSLGIATDPRHVCASVWVRTSCASVLESCSVRGQVLFLEKTM